MKIIPGRPGCNASEGPEWSAAVPMHRWRLSLQPTASWDGPACLAVKHATQWKSMNHDVIFHFDQVMLYSVTFVVSMLILLIHINANHNIHLVTSNMHTYITLHCIALHCIAFDAFHCIALHYVTLHYIAYIHTPLLFVCIYTHII